MPSRRPARGLHPSYAQADMGGLPYVFAALAISREVRAWHRELRSR